MNWGILIKVLKRLLSIVGSIISFSFFLGIISILSAIVLVDRVKPSILFNLYVLIPIIILLVAFSAFLTLKGRSKKPKSDWFQNWSKKRKITVIAIFVSISIVVPLATRTISYSNDQRLLEDATKQFQVETTSGASRGQIENTLIELERQLTELRSKYVKRAPIYLIKVRMFVNESELHANTSSPAWADAYVQTAPGQPPIIYLPVEPQNQRFDKTAPTPNPAHEITHVVTQEVLGTQSMKLIPTFFNESLAQYESLGGLSSLFYRLNLRVFLLMQDPSMVLRERPPRLDQAANQKDVDIFYALSYEYARYFADKYGEKGLWLVVEEVGKGIDFDSAFTDVTGKQYVDSYIDFSKHWLFAPVIVNYYQSNRS